MQLAQAHRQFTAGLDAGWGLGQSTWRIKKCVRCWFAKLPSLWDALSVLIVGTETTCTAMHEVAIRHPSVGLTRLLHIQALEAGGVLDRRLKHRLQKTLDQQQLAEQPDGHRASTSGRTAAQAGRAPQLWSTGKRRQHAPVEQSELESSDDDGSGRAHAHKGSSGQGHAASATFRREELLAPPPEQLSKWQRKRRRKSERKQQQQQQEPQQKQQRGAHDGA